MSLVDLLAQHFYEHELREIAGQLDSKAASKLPGRVATPDPVAHGLVHAARQLGVLSRLGELVVTGRPRIAEELRAAVAEEPARAGGATAISTPTATNTKTGSDRPKVNA